MRGITKKNNLSKISEEIEDMENPSQILPQNPSTVNQSKDSKKQIELLITAIKKGEGGFDEFIREEDQLGNLDLANTEGWHPIHYAVNSANKLAVRKLVDSKHELNVENNEGITPLMLCVSKKESEIMKIIIDSNRVDINKVTKNGTAIHVAIKTQNKFFINYLVSKGANPKIVDQNGQKAIELIDDNELKEKIEKMYEELQSISSISTKPETVRGTVFKTGLFFRNLKKRYIVINTSQRTLVRYQDKKDSPHKPIEIIPLSEIQSVKEIQSKLFLQSGFFYFQIYFSTKILFATKSKNLTLKWVTYLRKAIDYSIKYDEAMRSSAFNANNSNKILDKPPEEIDLDESDTPKKIEALQTPKIKYKINLSSFVFNKFLGGGAFGRVYKAKLKITNQIYAMKVLNKEKLYTKNQIKYAISEASILKNSNHPFILSLHFAFQTPSWLYMAVDYCSGGDLAILIAQNEFLSEEDTRFFTAELILAIEHLHTMGVLYRDLKPENILLDADGHIKLADFGLSRENIGRNEIAKSFWGSHIYLSPEMVSMKGFSQSSDLYGVGLCIYEMVFGQLPFYNEDIAELHSQIKKNEVTFPDPISPDLEDLLRGLLKKNPVERLGSASKEEIKRHPWFKGINWNDVINKKYSSPFPADDDFDRMTRTLRINDRDYTDENKNLLRVNDFSFVRESEIEGKVIVDPLIRVDES